MDQVCIGSCTNSSLYDMLKVAALLKGKTISPDVSLSISPGSKQVLSMLADCGALSDILASGANVRADHVSAWDSHRTPQVYRFVLSTVTLKGVQAQKTQKCT